MGRKSRAKQEARRQPEPETRAAAPAAVSTPPVRPPLKHVLWVGVAASLLRIFFAVLYHDSPFFHVPVVDASTFQIWAETIAQGREFMPGPFFKPPLYPYLLAMLQGILGPSPAAVYAVQALLGIATSLLVLVLGRRFFSPRTALYGALIYALLPVPVFLEFQLLAESWTTFLTVLAILPLVRLAEGRPTAMRDALFAGALLGVAALGRPNLLVLPPIMAAWLWWRGRPRSWRPAAVLLAATLIAVSPATLHNLGQGQFVLVSANAGANLWAGIRPGADGATAIPIGIQWDDLQLECDQAGARGPAQANRHLLRRSVTEAFGRPGHALRLFARKALLLVNAHEGRNNIGSRYLAREQGVVVLHRWWPGLWLALPFALLGLLALWRPWWLAAAEPRPGVSVLLLYLGALAVVVLMFFVNARFRAPLLPGLALVAAHGLVTALAAWQRRRRPAGLVAAVALIVMATLVNVDWLGMSARETGSRDELNLAGILARGFDGGSPDLEAAFTHFERALVLDPSDPDVPERYGLHLQSAAYTLLQTAGRARQEGRDGRVQEDAAAGYLGRALAFHEKAVALFPRSFRSLGSVANCRTLLGQIDAEQARVAHLEGQEDEARRLADSAARHLIAALATWSRSLGLKPDQPSARQSLDGARGTLLKLPDLSPAIADAKRRAGLG